METIISFLECTKIIANKEWRTFFDTELIDYMDFEYFIKRDENRAIMFFNPIDGYDLRKYSDINNLFFIFRPRGIVPEESYFKNKNIFKKIVLNYIEKKAVKLSDYFIFISESQRVHFLSKYQKFKNIENNSVLPNIKTKINSFIKPKDIESKVKIVYSGGFSKWQNIELIFPIINKLIKKNDCTFTILTFKENFEKATQLAKYYNILDNLVLKYVLPNKFDEELSNYDIGIIIRDDSIVNLTASPFKIYDYISNGLGIIITDNLAIQVNEILNEEYYFAVTYVNGDLLYSEDNLNKYVNNMINGKNKFSIIENYESYISNIDKLNFKQIFK
ncbi:hypothetical protein [Desulfosporosinus lacus]|nr:hypothetical protein [Desulfosporosinus lacus]